MVLKTHHNLPTLVVDTTGFISADAVVLLQLNIEASYIEGDIVGKTTDQNIASSHLCYSSFLFDLVYDIHIRNQKQLVEEKKHEETCRRDVL